jgi:hypothetical protein
LVRPQPEGTGFSFYVRADFLVFFADQAGVFQPDGSVRVLKKSVPSSMPTESTTEQLDVDGLVSLKINRQHIEPDLIGRIGQNEKVLARQPAEHSGFIVVDGGFGSGDAPAAARFHFDKAEGIAFPGHQVKIAGRFATAPAARYDSVAMAAKVEESCLFTYPPKFEVRRLTSPEANGERITGVDESLEESQAKHAPHCLRSAPLCQP